MKKILVLLFLLFTIEANAQPINKKQYTLTTAARTDGLTVRGQGIAYYKVAWNVIGTASACSFTLDGSRDNSTWNASVIGATTCTSDGVTAMTAAGTSNSYVSINLTSFIATQNASIILTILGYTDASAGISGGLGTSTYVAYFDSCCTLKGNSGFTYDGAGTSYLSASLGIGLANISGYNLTVHSATNENITIAGHTGLSTGITLRGLNDTGAGLVGVELRASDLLYTTDDTFKVVRGGVTVETLSATGWAFTAISSSTMTVNGALPTGYVFSVVAGTSQLNGRVYAANLTTSAGVQSGIVCVGATGELINDSVACIASSIKFKHNIKPLDKSLGLKTVLAMRPVNFYYNDAGPVLDNINHNMEQIGFIAEEAEKVDKRLVGYDNQGNIRTFRYENYVASLTLAIQEQQKEINELKKKVNSSQTKF